MISKYWPGKYWQKNYWFEKYWWGVAGTKILAACSFAVTAIGNIAGGYDGYGSTTFTISTSAIIRVKVFLELVHRYFQLEVNQEESKDVNA